MHIRKKYFIIFLNKFPEKSQEVWRSSAIYITEFLMRGGGGGGEKTRYQLINGRENIKLSISSRKENQFKNETNWMWHPK